MCDSAPEPAELAAGGLALEAAEPAEVPSAGVKGATRIEDPTRAQRTIGRRSAEARAIVPDLTVTATVEMSACLVQAEAQGWSIDAILVRACALALREHPRANGSYRDGRYELHSRVNIGIAVETDDARLVPTVFDADRKSVTELTGELQGLQARARGGELAAPELGGATFAVSRFEGSAIDAITPIVTPPQAAALAAGSIQSVPVARGPDIVPGQSMTLTLACDGRILFEVPAARLLSEIASLLAEVAL
jgi:pyruvate dehydrogenase E2 component (dihydrolipoamide acetyltransferase)